MMFMNRKTNARGTVIEVTGASENAPRHWEDQKVLLFQKSTHRQFEPVHGVVHFAYDASRYGKPALDFNQGSITVAELDNTSVPFTPIAPRLEDILPQNLHRQCNCEILAIALTMQVLR